ncbi:hypothetical protein D3C81_1248550 [compost metagenome]
MRCRALAGVRVRRAFHVALALAQGVIDARFPLAIERTLQEQIQRLVGALHRHRPAPIVRRHLERGVPLAVLVRETEGIAVTHIHDEATAIDAFRTRNGNGRGIDVHLLELGLHGRRVTGVIHRRLEVAVGQLGTVVPLFIQLGLEAKDELILVRRLQVGRCEAAGVLVLAGFVV